MTVEPSSAKVVELEFAAEAGVVPVVVFVGATTEIRAVELLPLKNKFIAWSGSTPPEPARNVNVLMPKDKGVEMLVSASLGPLIKGFERLAPLATKRFTTNSPP